MPGREEDEREEDDAAEELETSSALAASTPYFQEFHVTFRDESLGVVLQRTNELPVVKQLERAPAGARGAAEARGVTRGAVIVAVNGAPTTRQAYEETVRRVKGAGRPVTLGFRRLHAVSDPGMRHRRYWQGYLFAREHLSLIHI